MEPTARAPRETIEDWSAPPFSARTRAQQRVVIGFLTVSLLVFEALGAAGITSRPSTALSVFLDSSNPFLAMAFAGAALLCLTARLRAHERVAAAVAGGLLEVGFAAIRILAGMPFGHVLSSIGYGIGFTALGVVAFRAVVGRDVDRRAHADSLRAAVTLPLYVLAAHSALGVLSVTQPAVLDPHLLAIERFLWDPLTATVSFQAWLSDHPALFFVIVAVYVALPLALASLQSMRERARDRTPIDALVAFVALGFAGYALYHACPMIGPDAFRVDVVGALGLADATRVEPVAAPLSPPRNCMPSLHTAWALAIHWLSRGCPRGVRIATGLFTASTLVATIVLGHHYYLDLVVAVPFTLAVLAAVSPTKVGRARTQAIVVGGALTLAWIVLVVRFPQPLAASPAATVLLVVATLAASVGLHARFFRALDALASSAVTEPVAAPLDRATPRDPALGWMTAAFATSGAAALAYEVMFAKSLATLFGSTARASTMVLATYMGGMAIGAWIGGRIATERAQSLRIYAGCEVAVAVLCALFPWTSEAIRAAYVALALGLPADGAAVTTLQVLLGVLVLAPPTVLMGVTTPVLARFFGDREEPFGRTVARLYSANTIGAALGTLAMGYVLLPVAGLQRSTWAAAALGLLAALIALRVDRMQTGSTQLHEPTPSSSADRALEHASRRSALVALIVLGVGGVVTLALETVYIHLLAVVAGNSAYAFSVMLFSFLVGLGLGSLFARARPSGPGDAMSTLARRQWWLAAVVLAGVFVWERIPAIFVAFGESARVATFESRELIRLLVCSSVMIPVSALIGATYPIAMETAAQHVRGARLVTFGRASALNTGGNIIGAVLGGMVLVPALGSLRSLHVLAAITALLALAATLSTARRARASAARPLPAVLVLVLLQPSAFDLTLLASGAHVYFEPHSYGDVIDHAESADGGLTTVTQARVGERYVRTLLTNGKFQGDDGEGEEMPAQMAFALTPLLHTVARERALVIGYGTGVTARTVADAGFAELEIAELSRDVLNLANEHFSRLNGRISESARARTFVTDGRNHLLLSTREYDLVSIEISSIWFAGAASLYNREFYEIARARLSERGVLQQWLQLHRLSTVDIATVLATVRSVFSRVWLYEIAGQGMIVACDHECEPRREALETLQNAPELAHAREMFGGSFVTLLDGRQLTPDALDRMLAGFRIDGDERFELVSTDDNRLLEYSTPRANVRRYAPSLRNNLEMLRRYRPSERVAGTRLSVEDLADLERHLAAEP